MQAGPGGSGVSFGISSRSGAAMQYTNLVSATADPYTCFTFIVPLDATCDPNSSAYSLRTGTCR